jgi:hypothetical protein
MHGDDEKYKQNFVGRHKGRGNLGDSGVDGSLIIKIYLKDINCEDVGLVQLGQRIHLDCRSDLLAYSQTTSSMKITFKGEVEYFNG